MNGHALIMKLIIIFAIMTKMQDGKMNMMMRVMLLVENIQNMSINQSVIIIIIARIIRQQQLVELLLTVTVKYFGLV
ncbi:hypothetical protein D7V90_17980 [bacterium 1xD42-87]|nr:hypothetical protein D7V90_17980 [bacterium 1xD42-87]